MAIFSINDEQMSNWVGVEHFFMFTLYFSSHDLSWEIQDVDVSFGIRTIVHFHDYGKKSTYNIYIYVYMRNCTPPSPPIYEVSDPFHGFL